MSASVRCLAISNYGPIVIPEKGMTVNLQDSLNFALYKRVIEAYEGQYVGSQVISLQLTEKRSKTRTPSR